MKLLQDEFEEPDEVQRTICLIIELQETRNLLQRKNQIYQDRVKALFDKNIKRDEFFPIDLVLRWDSGREEKGKHGKFDNLWFDTFKISEVLENNTFILQSLDVNYLSSSFNGRFSKKKNLLS